ncbi:MAG: hypothetical protein AABO58_16680 [Acidobacteriota bacterium]
MTRIPFQFVLTIAACYGLWRLWRWVTRGADQRIAAIVTAGFLLRMIVAQALFWIAWLPLPIARSLQIGPGFWFFAVDGPGYLQYADFLSQGDVRMFPSRVFVYVLTVFVAALGGVASTAIVLNCAAFLGTCAVIIRIGRHRASAPVLVALAAVAFGPGSILWSLQPLKDTFFLFLATAMIGACFWWQEGALTRRFAPPSPASGRGAKLSFSRLREKVALSAAKGRMRVACAVAMLVLTYALAGIRWYFAVFIWLAWGIFGLLVALGARRKLSMLLASAVLFALLAFSVQLGARDELPGQLILRRPAPAKQLIAAQRGFAQEQGKTTIKPGPAIAAVPPPREEKLKTTIEPGPAVTAVPPPPPREEKMSQRIIAGVAATFLPHVVGEALGLVRVGGGRGLWLFAELDTLCFDAVLLFAIVYSIRARGRVTPLFVMLVLLFLMTAGPLLYVVNNFGTLFRLRQMLYLIAAILPVTRARAAEEGASEAAGRQSGSR